ncbi:MAG: multidrug ABC transporter substrate-binding protein [Deltaproteobacteria bacterium RBG_13_43_22]|nr:MAG: multidrug ABC transporter substrate-binding protein [Deltaproteobacteria bacterium RBG_13_43_22]
MKPISSLKVALRALQINKMRSFLTMLGIIIGVGAVIVMVAIGAGAREMIAQQIASMGSNLLMVVPGATTAGGARMGGGSASSLTSDDAKAIKEECPAVKTIAPFWGGVTQVIYGNQNWNTSVTGTLPSYFEIREWALASGRNFSDQELAGAVKVAIIGKSIVENLFGSEDPLGQIIRIKKIPFTVIGVLTPKGQSSYGTDQDDTIYIPLSTAQKRVFGSRLPNRVRMIMVQAQDLSLMAAAEKQINDLLTQRHKPQGDQLADFTVRNLTEIMATAEQSAKVMSLLLGSIALVSLLVGGIGIMNIMLVSVTERTREIGIRMAVGARGIDILFQFLTESVVLSLVGGLIGIGLGVLGAELTSKFTGWNVVISILALLISFFFAAAVGIFFGYYPAHKASRLNPIDALRYE